MAIGIREYPGGLFHVRPTPRIKSNFAVKINTITTMTREDIFQQLKDICDTACHERHACAAGYKQMLASDNVSEMMATWRTNWQDVINDKFADFMAAHLPALYPDIEQEMNESGIYMNCCPEDAKNFVLVIVCDSDTPVHIYGEARAYVLGTAHVIAHDHSRVVSTRNDSVEVTLLDYSYGTIQKGYVTARDRSTLTSACPATVNGSVVCRASGGTVTAVAYRSIEATGDTIVYARSGKGIHLEGNAQLKSITDNE